MKYLRIGLWFSLLVPFLLFLLVPQLPAQEVGSGDLAKYQEARKLYSAGRYEESLRLFKEIEGKNLGFWRNFRVNRAIKQLQARLGEKDTQPTEKTETPAAVPETETPAAVPETETPAAVRETETPAAVREAETAAAAPEKERKPVLHRPEGSEDEKSRVLAILEKERHLEKIASERAKFLAQHHINMGKSFYNKLDYEKARSEFQIALTMNPRSEEALLYLEKCNAMLDIRKARIPEFARREFEMNKARVERARMEMERLYQEGKRLLEDGDFDKSIAKFMAVREIAHWMPYKEDVSEYDRGTTELIGQAKEERELRKEELDRVRREEAARALAGEIGLEKEYKQKKIKRLMTQAVEFRRIQKFENAIALYEEVLILEPEHFRATIGRMDCRVSLMDKKNREMEEDKSWETQVSWLSADTLSIPQSKVIKKPDNWEIVRKRTIPRFGRAIDVPPWRPPMEEDLGTKKVSIFFTETPLSQVLQFLGDLTEIDFVADLGEEAVDPLVTIRVNSMTLRNVLNWIATLSGTRWGLKNEAVYFGRGTVEDSVLRFYPIRDLMYEPTDFPGSGFALSGTDSGDGFELEEAVEEITRFDSDMLINFIKNIDEQSWNDAEGRNKLEYHAGMLLIINTPEAHQKVEDLLSHFRATRGLQVNIHAQFLELQDNFLEDLGIDFTATSSESDFNWDLEMEHLNDGQEVSQIYTSSGVLPGRGGGAGLTISILDDIQVRAIINAVQKKATGNILVAPRLTCFDGQRANVTVAEQVSYISDYEVETGGEGGVGASPVIERALDGVSLDVRPIVSADRRFITIEVRPTLARLRRPFRTVEVSLGEDMDAPVDLPEAALKTVQTTVMIPDGGTILMGGLMDRAELEHTISIPFLSKIPILNNLFRRKAKGVERRNLILLMRGKIVSLDERLGDPI